MWFKLVMTLEFIFQALLRAEGVEITVPLHALPIVRSTPEMDTRQFVLKYFIFLSKNYREECVPACMPLDPEMLVAYLD
jgi:hypothetical protein